MPPTIGGEAPPVALASDSGSTRTEIDTTHDSQGLVTSTSDRGDIGTAADDPPTPARARRR